MKYKDTYKAYTKLKKNKQDTFYNEHTADIILFESAKKYLKEHLGESKILAISKWKDDSRKFKNRKKETLQSNIRNPRRSRASRKS